MNWKLHRISPLWQAYTYSTRETFYHLTDPGCSISNLKHAIAESLQVKVMKQNPKQKRNVILKASKNITSRVNLHVSRLSSGAPKCQKYKWSERSMFNLYAPFIVCCSLFCLFWCKDCFEFSGQIRAGKGVKHLYIAYRCQKPRAAMSGLASSSLFDVSGKHSPVRGWSIGSVCTQ